MLRISPNIALTSDRWFEVDRTVLSEGEQQTLDNLVERKLIAFHPDDNGGKPIPVGDETDPQRARQDAATKLQITKLANRVAELEAENRELRASAGTSSPPEPQSDGTFRGAAPDDGATTKDEKPRRGR